MVPVWILAVAALSDYDYSYGGYGYGYGYGEEKSNEESNKDVALRRHRAFVHRTVVFTNNLVALLRGPGSDEEQEQAAWRLGRVSPRWATSTRWPTPAFVRVPLLVRVLSNLSWR